jgi:hypothetical protein
MIRADDPVVLKLVTLLLAGERDYVDWALDEQSVSVAKCTPTESAKITVMNFSRKMS